MGGEWGVARVGGWWGSVGSRRQVTPSIRTQTVVLCLQLRTDTGTIHRVDRGGRQQ